MGELHIGGITVGENHQIFVIAEIGHNHQGNPELARAILKAARESGATAAKLQKRHLPSLFTADFARQPYHSEHAFGTTYLEHRAALELDDQAWHDLAAYARDIGILFFATAFDIPSADFLVGLGVPALKIGSGDALNWPLLDHAATLGVPLIVSTGGLSWDDVDATAQRLAGRGAQFALLQCTSTYPCPPEELDLSVITVMRQRYPETVIGYSGHEQGIIPSLAAAALGAAIIERHFTTDNSLRGSDQRYSLTPETMAELIQGASIVRRSLGSGVKHRHPSEQPALHKLGKKLVAATDLPAGHILSRADLAVRSPADGLSPHLLDQVVGTRLLRPLKRHEALTLQDTWHPALRP
ncbi:MAG: N-acetylneuraminate synthase family protein [Streptosporangiaceae bacterium]